MSIITQNGKVVLVNGKGLSSSGSGGGVISADPKDVNFIDYDGTIVYSYTKAEFAQLDALPTNPSHVGLTAQGWNWTKNEITAQLTAMSDQPVWVGQMYVTSNGKTEIDIELNDANLLAPYLKFAVDGTVEVNWGDDSTPDTVTGTSLSSSKYTPHTYASTGKYTISIGVTSGSFRFYNNYILTHTNTTNNASRRYNSSIIAVRLGNGITSIANSAFYYCHSLRSVTIPSGVTSIGNSAFSSCHLLQNVIIPSGMTSIGTYVFSGSQSLRSVSIPSSVTSIEANAFYNCYSLQNVTVPSGVTSIGSYTFGNCYSLRSVTIPSGVTSIGNSAFYCNYSLQKMTIPSGVTSIGTYAFYYGYSLYKLTFKPTTPPTVDNSNAFTSLPTDCIIYVPSGKLSAYTTATNYPSSSTYTYMEET